MSLKDINIDEFKEYYASHQSKEVAEKYGIAPSTVAGWARKLNFPRKSFQHLNYQGLEFTEYQKQILIGSMLGDGSLNKVLRKGDNSHFEEGHGIAQLGWLEWKQAVFQPFSKHIKFKKVKGIKNINKQMFADDEKTHEACNLFTMKHPYFTELEQQWYLRDEFGNYIYKEKNNKKYRIKIVPEFELTPLILAVWYMDDGSKDVATKRIKFSTQSFTKEEIAILIEKIKRLGIHDCNIGEHTGQVIYIGTYSYLDFINLVKNELLDLPKCMKYKIDLSDYNPSAKWSDNKTGIPFFGYNGKNYRGTVMINYTSYCLGSYDYDTAKKVSEEVEYLVRHRCKNPEKFMEINNKYN